MKDFEKIFDENFSSIDDMESVLSALKAAGMNQIDTVKLIMKKTSFGLKAADDIVLYSETWKNEKEDTMDLRDLFWSVMLED